MLRDPIRKEEIIYLILSIEKVLFQMFTYQKLTL